LCPGIIKTFTRERVRSNNQRSFLKSCEEALFASPKYSRTENNFLFLIQQKKKFLKNDFFYRLVSRVRNVVR